MVTVVCRQLCATSKGGFVIPYNRIMKNKKSQNLISFEYLNINVIIVGNIHQKKPRNGAFLL